MPKNHKYINVKISKYITLNFSYKYSIKPSVCILNIIQIR